MPWRGILCCLLILPACVADILEDGIVILNGSHRELAVSGVLEPDDSDREDDYLKLTAALAKAAKAAKDHPSLKTKARLAKIKTLWRDWATDTDATEAPVVETSAPQENKSSFARRFAKLSMAMEPTAPAADPAAQATIIREARASLAAAAAGGARGGGGSIVQSGAAGNATQVGQINLKCLIFGPQAAGIAAREGKQLFVDALSRALPPGTHPLRVYIRDMEQYPPVSDPVRQPHDVTATPHGGTATLHAARHNATRRAIHRTALTHQPLATCAPCFAYPTPCALHLRTAW